MEKSNGRSYFVGKAIFNIAYALFWIFATMAPWIFDYFGLKIADIWEPVVVLAFIAYLTFTCYKVMKATMVAGKSFAKLKKCSVK